MRYRPGLQQLERLCDVLLNENDPVPLEAYCAELYALLSHLASFEPEGMTGGVTLTSGLALEPASAASCLLDARRTAVFLRGVAAALQAAERTFEDERIEVVYAGTGPFATLMTPLLGRLSADRFHVTLIDIHEESIAALQRLVDRLGLPMSLLDVVCADATVYRHPGSIHVAVSETMQQALTREPFVAIVGNLRPQLHRAGFLVPERVTVSATAIDAEQERTRWAGRTDASCHAHIANVLEVSRRASTGTRRTHRLTAPPLPADREQWLALLTTIRVFENHALETYASGLTTPKILWAGSPVHTGEEIELAYTLDASPDFTVSRIPAA